MKCEDVLLLISGHLDHSNTETEEAQLQMHLAQCDSCRSLMETLQAADAGILSLEEEAPEDLCQNVMAAIAREAPVRKRRRRAWITTAAAALVLAMGIGALALPEIQTKRASKASEQDFLIMSRMMPEETDSAQIEAQDAAAAGMSLSKSAAVDALPDSAYDAASGHWLAQDLADELQADVALVSDLLPELNGCAYEILADGSLLYTLETAYSAAALCWNYPDFAVLFQPEAAMSEVSYALLLP